MEFNVDDFNTEEIAKVNELINSIKKEKESQKKWWIVATYNMFENPNEYNQLGNCYHVEEQKESYSKSNPPLKTNFLSKESAEKWLKNYLNEEKIFNTAINEIENLTCNLGYIVNKLRKHNMISEDDWNECFDLFNNCKKYGVLAEVTK